MTIKLNYVKKGFFNTIVKAMRQILQQKIGWDSHVFSPPFPAYMFAGIIADKSLEHIECLG